MRSWSIAIGLAAAVLFLALMGATRLFMPQADATDVVLREIEILPEPPPPPPPPEEEPPPEAPPPPPALTDVSNVPDPTLAPIPKADLPMDITMPVDPFFTDLAPAPLPQPAPAPVARPKVAAVAPPKPTPKPKSMPRPATKSHYSVNELDGKPRLLRHGRTSFPSELARRGISQGKVTLKVQLSPSGGVSVLGVISSTHPELVEPARRVAAGSKFTSPMKNGLRVSAIMQWPITIRK